MQAAWSRRELFLFNRVDLVPDGIKGIFPGYGSLPRIGRRRLYLGSRRVPGHFS